MKTENKPDLYSCIAVNAGGMFNNHVGFYGGLGVSGYSWITEASTAGNKVTTTQKQTYIDVPLFLHIVTSRPGRVGFFTNVGANASILGAAKYSNNAKLAVKDRENKADFYGFNISPFVQLGLSIPLSTRGEIYIGPKIQAQVLNNFDDTIGTTGYLLANSLNVGVLLYL